MGQSAGQWLHLWLEQGGLDGRHSSSLSGHGTLSQLPHLSSSFLSSKMRVIVPSFWSHRVIVGGGGEGKMKEFQRPQEVVADVTGNELCHFTAPFCPFCLSAFLPLMVTSSGQPSLHPQSTLPLTRGCQWVCAQLPVLSLLCPAHGLSPLCTQHPADRQHRERGVPGTL